MRTSGKPVKLAIYGDSYTVGRGTSDPSRRWSSLVCAGRGWQELNEGINGLGFVRKREDRDGHSAAVERIVAAGADVVLVSLGTNDTVMFNEHAEAIAHNMTVDLSDLRHGLPESRILVLEPFWAYTELPYKVVAIRAWLAKAAADTGLTYVDGVSTYFAGHPELLDPDGLHANDAGHLLIAQFIDNVLTQHGL